MTQPSSVPEPPSGAPSVPASPGRGRAAHASSSRRRRILLGAAFTALAGVMVGVGVASADGGGTQNTREPAVAKAGPGRHHDAVQKSLDRLIDDGIPGALAAVRDPGGRTRHYTAGVGDLRTRSKVPVDGKVRIASNTKMFTATVVLQLVGEGKVGLDEPVETYLPGLVRGDGIDGRDITVRQLLQHTSGLPDYDDDVVKDYLTKQQHRHFEPRETLDLALAKKAEFAPGTDWGYSNTNYTLAGLIVQRVTGRPIGEEITKRVIEPLRLRDTYWPGVGDQTVKGRHPHGYFRMTEDEPWADVTVQDPSAAWAAGALIGTPSDLNRFLTSLLDGKLLKPAQLTEMQKTVEAPGFDVTDGSTYGLGLATIKLSCGGFAWTHGGDAVGYSTRNGVTEDGRAATVAVTATATTLDVHEHLADALDTALCET